MEDKPYKIGVIPGDLNGITVTDATLKILQPIPTDRKLDHTTLPFNADFFLREGITELQQEHMDELRKYDAIFLGAVGDPTKIKPGVLEVGILLKARQELDQYVNLRPVILPEGVPTILAGKGPSDINFEICRENTEGLYVNEGSVEHAGTVDEIARQVMRCTYRGVKRLADYAAERALNRPERRSDRKPRLHFVFKNNVLTYAAAPWNRVHEEFRKREDIDVRYMHIDNFLMQMLTNPDQFDVVVTENMFGDIATDAGAMIQGGIGSAVSGNIDPTRRNPSMFEPIHGTAPDKWYGPDGKHDPSLVQSVRPEAAMMSYAMMLEHLGETRAAKVLKLAALKNLKDPNYKQMKLDELVAQATESARQASFVVE